tara:strand:- start:92 stop:211 length:120 start_codon:yes stop_codon:yes gene_type:complete
MIKFLSLLDLSVLFSLNAYVGASEMDKNQEEFFEDQMAT